MSELALQTWPALIASQAGAVTRGQARRHGQSDGAIAAHLAAHRWQRATTSVYVTFTGPLPVGTRRWVALLAAGNGAVLSHETAAELWGLRPPSDGLIHVTVAAKRIVSSPSGVRVHRSRRLERSSHPTATPPRTTVEATVLDMASDAVRLSDALALVTLACQSRLTSAAKLSDELRRRRTQRWRSTLLDTVSDAAEGAHSLLELRYLRDVERAHGLPAGRRQKSVANTFQDVSYDGFATVVELDGRQGHADPDSRWRDMTRDNASAARGVTTLRYGWADVTTRPCAVAAQVVGVLHARGWSGTPRKCVDSCEL